MLPEPPDGTRIEFEYYTDVYAAWRDDDSSRRAGWSHGDGGKVWVVYPGSVPKTWAELGQEFGWDVLALAVRLVPHPDDVANYEKWPTHTVQMREAAARALRRARALTEPQPLVADGGDDPDLPWGAPPEFWETYEPESGS